MTELSPDEQFKILQGVKGLIKEEVSQQKLHNKPSPNTLNFMTKMETELVNIKEKLEKMPTRDEMLLCVEKAIDTALEKSDKKFASKTTERIVQGMVGAILLFVLGKILNIV